ncbi:hypothetical protein [Pseudomonas typographi]|uniref:Secreted protein n=1 Tax=Pseudomonas typographi TaxID=2715964 RepID=A0ABR7YZP7_9PSED|nr:hypothetical protein [Pseudomonas typographi]MBD1550657.1 hypothetical protein [Pseudomonas typographi]MBD1586758.1 hypothetical protein [Pseudomonas typographi]MBD1598652.1 hypothetical protein [Pseudomonas typographi]
MTRQGCRIADGVARGGGGFRVVAGLFLRRLAAIALALAAATVQAAPAPWYSYRSLADNHVICAQTDPGPPFIRFAGPFRNAGCRR